MTTDKKAGSDSISSQLHTLSHPHSYVPLITKQVNTYLLLVTRGSLSLLSKMEKSEVVHDFHEQMKMTLKKKNFQNNLTHSSHSPSVPTFTLLEKSTRVSQNIHVTALSCIN